MELNVALLVFNRPETTRVVFAEIRRARPARLFVVADGPRPERPDDAAKCSAVRSLIDNGVDWDCEVHKHYSDQNLGCRLSPPAGLDWVFQHVESCVILEDDCLPHPSFFPYCQELLEKYWDDERVMTISGDNFQFGRGRTQYSYYFSRMSHIWGWATWRRAWQKYDIDMKLWPDIEAGGWLTDLFPDGKQARHWEKVFGDSAKGLINTWDHQWAFSCLVHNGLCILPRVNLISNIGFGQDATHTTQEGIASRLAVDEMCFPLIHPPFVISDRVADAFTFEVFHPTSRRAQIQRLLSRLLPPAARRRLKAKSSS